VLRKFLLLVILSLIPNLAISCVDSCPCWHGSDNDKVSFTVSGGFFNPVISAVYTRQHHHSLCCNTGCSMTIGPLGWYGQCGVADYGMRYCARMIKDSGQSYICLFWDPLDGDAGLDNNVTLSPFHAPTSVMTSWGGSTPIKTVTAFATTSGTAYMDQHDCEIDNGTDPSACALLGAGESNVVFNGVTYNPKLGVGPSITLPTKKIMCDEVFGDCTKALNPSLMNTYFNFEQQYPATQASTYTTALGTPGNLVLNAFTGNQGYDGSDGFPFNPLVCVAVPLAPAPPPFCPVMSILSPTPQLVNICEIGDFVGYSSLNSAPQVFYNTVHSSTLSNSCEEGLINGSPAYNSYITPTARVTFQNPVAPTSQTLTPTSNGYITSAAAQAALPTSTSFTNATNTNFRVLYGSESTNLFYASSYVESFDNINNTDLTSVMLPIAVNVANYCDIQMNLNSTAPIVSPNCTMNDPDGNSRTFYLADMPASASQLAGNYLYGDTSDGSGGTQAFVVGMLSKLTPPKPIVAACGSSGIDPNIKIGGSNWTIAKTTCSSTHTNPGIAWSIDRTQASITSPVTLDYQTSNTFVVQSAQSNNATVTITPLPTNFGEGYYFSVYDEVANNGYGNSDSSGCTTPDPIYGCYFNPPTSTSAVPTISCGSAPVSGAIYLTGIEFAVDTNSTINCLASGAPASTAATPISPLLYIRGGKYSCLRGAHDPGEVLTKPLISSTATNKTPPTVNAANCSLSSNAVPSTIISDRLDPPYTNPILSATAYTAPSSMSTMTFPQAYLDSITAANDANGSAAILSAYSLGTKTSASSGQGCSNSRLKNTLESGLCAPVPQPTCGSYSTNYTQGDPNSASQKADGFANWNIAEGLVYGSIATGTCVQGYVNANGLPPMRLCTLNSETTALADLVVKSTSSTSSVSTASTTSDTTADITKSTVYNSCIPDEPDWWPTKMRYQPYGNSGDIFTQAEWSAVWLKQTGGIKFTPYVNECHPLQNANDAQGNSIAFCRTDDKYIYFTYFALKYEVDDEMTASAYKLFLSVENQQCIPTGVTYPDGLSTGSTPVAYQETIMVNTPNAGYWPSPCCPLSAPKSRVENECCCPDSVKDNFGMCPGGWCDGSIDNTCLKDDSCK
jgi:hypothetical protein